MSEPFDPFDVLRALNPVDPADLEGEASSQQAGDALQRVWRQDPSRRRHRVVRSGRRRLAVGVALAVLVLGGGGAIASSLLRTPADEEVGMTEGYRLFADSQPHCASLSGTSFRCTLAKAPTGELFYHRDGGHALDMFLGITAETVDDSHRVDGACVSVSADGRSWDCYLGDEAVSHGLLSPNYLGTYLPNPPTA